MSRDPASLLDMLGAARRALARLATADRSAFLADELMQDAVIRQLLVLGEAATRVSPEFRSRHREIPWRMIVGMRNWLIHAYDDVDLEIVWGTVRNDLPRLIATLEPLVPPAEPS